MKIQLSQEQEKFIQEQITSGQYINADEIISEALKLLELRANKIKELKAQIAIGTEQIAQGKVTDGEVVFARLQEKINRISQE